MQKIALTKNGKEILGSDGIMFIDGRKTITNQIEEVKKRNKSLIKNFPHKVADGFYKVDRQYKQISDIINF